MATKKKPATPEEETSDGYTYSDVSPAPAARWPISDTQNSKKENA